jgi:type I restriction enzyme S subunit
MSYQSIIASEAITRAFGEINAEMLEALVTNHEQAQILADLRDTLLPRLISGKLRLPEAEELLAST